MKKFLARVAYWLNKSQSFYSHLFYISALCGALGSCTKNNSFGLEINPESQLISTFQSDTFSIHTFTVLSDSIRTDELNGPSPLGNYLDPVFGNVNASIYTQIRLEQAYDFRPSHGSLDSIVIDSIIMYLSLNGYYGDIHPQTFRVEQLTDPIYTDSSYFNNSTVPVSTTDLSFGNTIYSNPLLPGYFAGQSVNKAILSIPLDPTNFALPIINQSGNPTLDGNDGDDGFLSWYYGLKISSPSNTNGGLYYIDMTDSYSRIRMYYRDTTGASSDHDTLDFDFNINANCAYYHHVEHDYSNTAVEVAINQNENNQLYIQSLGGVNGQLYIPGLDSLRTKNIMINKAEVILPFDDYSYDEYLAPLNLFLSRKKENSDEFLPDLFEGSLGGGYNNTSKNYSFNITRHVNELMADSSIQNDTISIIPSGNGISANRVVLNGMNSLKRNKAKAVITYTKY